MLTEQSKVTYDHCPDSARLEHWLFRQFEDLLIAAGFKYVSIPSVIKAETIRRQEVQLGNGKLLRPEDCFQFLPGYVLSGSAEQGILEQCTGLRMDPSRYFALNQCFRNEPILDVPVRCYEFKKLEQFSFSDSEESALREFETLLANATSFLGRFGVRYRLVDVSHRDFGYHLKKTDIEVYTNRFGWIESHSCTYFGTEQSKRFDITGAKWTCSNTGIASPRILLPFMDGAAPWPRLFHGGRV